MLSFALPKGRLLEDIGRWFVEGGIDFDFSGRKLVAYDSTERMKFFLVKNSDLPTYIHHGIAGLGICGDDVLWESKGRFIRLLTLPFGSTQMCLAGHRGAETPSGQRRIQAATKFPVFTRKHFHRRGTAVEIIKLNGSVELAPVLGLTDYIVDIVETGKTLEANNLEVLEELETISVHLIANPAYYKLNYREIQDFLGLFGEAGVTK
ncbi:MAG: ATP phosphoribosyltransferase [Spirochaetales bacterium]|nr:ATP phosphoribosyltransferase [Spirochaetales bacterium]MCF7937072.1 ATP phosphoribosyltransferase [Spirochaetales bacterium]